MKKIMLIFIMMFNIILAQVSLSDLKSLGNEQLDQMRDELKAFSELEKSISDTDPIDIPEIVKIEKSITKVEESVYFGYEYFNRDIAFFDNLPAPSDYKLGPGDELYLTIWGEINIQTTLLINKDGLIYYDSIGFINLSNKTIKEAESILKEELSRIYATINDPNNSTNVRLSLGELKSINVYFSGHSKNPGINLIHPFADVFTAIGQAGGLDLDGSLRNIELIRNGEVISKIDFYSFFSDGKKNFANIRILDGDVIHIPTIINRVEINGEVITPGFYELLEDESIQNLIEYAGGLNPTASKKAILKQILPIQNRISDDIARTSSIINLSFDNSILISNGSKVSVLPIADNDTDVNIFGRVISPGAYPAFEVDITSKSNNVRRALSLKEVLDLAGGFNDPIFRKSIFDTIVILRLDENQFYSEEISVEYKDAAKFDVKINDQIFVYENSNYYNNFTYTIDGEVKKPGTYPLKQGLTLAEALNKAGGITELGSINSLSVTKPLFRIDEEGNTIEESESVSNVNFDFEISDKTSITILPKTNVIRVNGNVYNPGLVASKSNTGSMTMSKAIELAGGYKPYSMKSRAYVIRANGEIEKANLFRGRGKRIFPGDSVFVPLDPNPNEFDITSFIADLSTTLANIAAILIIVDNNKN